jgi:hypothetical protein
MESNVLPPQTTITAALPAGNNNIGDVDVASIAAGVNNIGDVDIASIAAGETTIGRVGGNSTMVTGTPVLTVAGAYAINDYVGTSGDALTLASCARVTGGTGIITRAILIDYALQSVSMELWLFDTEPAPPNDNAAWTISDADSLKCIAVIPFSTYYASAANSVSMSEQLAIAFKCAAGSQNLYACLVTRGAPTFASLDVSVRLGIVQD